YANLTGILGVMFMGGFVERLALRKVPLLPIVVGGLLAFMAFGTLLAQTLLMLIGFVVPRHFWLEYYHTLRIATPLGGVFGLGAFVHTSLRDRVQAMERTLQEKEVAEERTRERAGE